MLGTLGWRARQDARLRGAKGGRWSQAWSKPSGSFPQARPRGRLYYRVIQKSETEPGLVQITRWVSQELETEPGLAPITRWVSQELETEPGIVQITRWVSQELETEPGIV